MRFKFRVLLVATVATIVGTVPTVKVLDAKGNSMKNVLVRWRVTAGSGKVVNDSIRTTNFGDATSGGWTLGTMAGVQTLQATAEGIGAPVTYAPQVIELAGNRIAGTSVDDRAGCAALLALARAVKGQGGLPT